MTTISLSDPLSRSASGRLTALLATTDSLVPLVLRVALGIVILPHGLQKTFGWFGGSGFGGTMQWFDSIGIPAVLGILAIAADTLGALGLIAGVATRIAAFGVGVNMVVAALMVHRPNGFFMNWSGAQQGEGFEFHILATAMSLALIAAGGGKWSGDRALTSVSGR